VNGRSQCVAVEFRVFSVGRSATLQPHLYFILVSASYPP
jgi:hypothetical protein